MSADVIIYSLSALSAILNVALIGGLLEIARSRDEWRGRAATAERRCEDLRAITAGDVIHIAIDEANLKGGAWSCGYRIDDDGKILIEALEPVRDPRKGSFADPEAPDIIRRHLGDPPFEMKREAIGEIVELGKPIEVIYDESGATSGAGASPCHKI